MDKSLGESQACNHGAASANWSQRISVDEVPYPPPLNLPLTKTPKLISLVESALKESYPCPYQQKPPTLIHPQTPRPLEKKPPKSLHFRISRITIGTWTRVSVNHEDLTAKFYFAKKKLIWEILYSKEETYQNESLKKKIEMPWPDVSSLASSDLPDGTQVLVIELSKPPTFFEEVPSKPHTVWKQMDHDFTLNNSASTCRTHILYVAPQHGNLKKNLENLASLDSFWSQRFKVPFPQFQNPFFHSPVGNNNNNGNNPGHFSHDQTSSDLWFNPNNNVNYPAPYSHDLPFSFNVNNNDLLDHQSQGFGHMEVGEGDFSMPTQFRDNGPEQLFWMELLQQQSSQQQLTHEHYYRGESSTKPDLCNRVSQGMNQLLQAFPDPLLETQTNSRMFPNTNELSTYPQVGSYAAEIILRHEEERQNHDDQLFDEFWDQVSGNINDGSLPPDF